LITPSVIIGEGQVELFDWLMLAYHRQEQSIYPFKERREVTCSPGVPIFFYSSSYFVHSQAEKKYARQLFLSGATDESPDGDDEEEPEEVNEVEDEINALDEVDDADTAGIMGDGGDDDGGEGGGEGDDVENPLMAGTKVNVSKEDLQKEKDAQKKSNGEGKEGEEEEEGGETGEKKKKDGDDDEEEEDEVAKLIDTIKVLHGSYSISLLRMYNTHLTRYYYLLSYP
jgi:hypothetical protein